MHVLSRFSLGAIVLAVAALLAVAADAACLRHVAQDRPLLMPAAFGVGAVSPGQVGITYVGHASFLIETAGGVKIVTDYNDHVRAPLTPDIVTMNNAHSTHYSMIVEPGVVHALQGWGNEAGPVVHDLPYKDVQVRNVPTNVREYDRTRYNGNSIFVFETAQLCIAHLGHLHHRLTREHLTALGEIDVLMVPVDGSYTLNIRDMVEVIEQCDVFNEVAQQFNTARRTFPTVLIANMLGFAEKPYFEATEGAERPPTVDFSTPPAAAGS